MACMSTPQPPKSAILATHDLLTKHGVRHLLPASDANIVVICHECGYLCSIEFLQHLRDGSFVPIGPFDIKEMSMLLASLEARKRWRPGFHDERKSPARLALERGTATEQDEAVETLMQCLRFDFEMLLSFLQDGAREMTQIELDAICEVLRHRVGVSQTAASEAKEHA